MSDSLFDPIGAEWTIIAASELTISQHRGRTLDVDGTMLIFTGTYRGFNEDGDFIVIYGRNVAGISVAPRLRPGRKLLIKDKEATLKERNA